MRVEKIYLVDEQQAAVGFAKNTRLPLTNTGGTGLLQIEAAEQAVCRDVHRQCHKRTTRHQRLERVCQRRLAASSGCADEDSLESWLDGQHQECMFRQVESGDRCKGKWSAPGHWPLPRIKSRPPFSLMKPF